MAGQSASASESDIAAFKRDGAICLRGVFSKWVETIRAGIERNLSDPGPYGTENVAEGDTGSFFDALTRHPMVPSRLT